MRPKEAPVNMLLAMGIAAFLCIFIGSFPGPLYSLLPYPVEYVPYTASHVVGQTQLLFFSALAFSLLILSGIYPAEMRCVNLDADWFYRMAGKRFIWFCEKPLMAFQTEPYIVRKGWINFTMLNLRPFQRLSIIGLDTFELRSDTCQSMWRTSLYLL
jgi:hypothetical protein